MSAPAEKLFDVAPFQGPTTKEKRRKECDALKEKHAIWTHHTHKDWLALSMRECTAALNGYDLTTEQKTVPIMMLAGYCRLLDEAGMIEQGHETEWEAVTALARRLEAKQKP
jgi:hypothetical protein